MFNKEQTEFMKSLGLDFNFMSLSDEEYCRIEEVVGDAYTEEAQEYPDKKTDRIVMCESILDTLSEDEM